MEEFPSNAKNPETPLKKQDDKPAEKKVEKVIQGEAKQRKKSFGKKLKETFVADSGKSVVEYVALDVLVPAAKDMIADAAQQAVERLVFGEARTTTRRNRFTPASPLAGQVNYSRFSRSPSPVGRAAGRPDRAAQPTSVHQHDFGEILLSTRVEADTVLERLGDLIENYGTASVSDLYALLGMTAQYTDHKWGWVEFRGMDHSRVRDGYVLDLPRPVPLD